MSNNVTLPAQGVGTTQPIVESHDTGTAQRQSMTLASLGAPGAVTALSAGQKTAANSIPVVIASDQPNTGFTPAAGTNSLVVTNGVSVTAFAGPCNGGFITNPANAARQGISAAEPIYVDMVGTPGSTDAAANGTTVAIDPGSTFTVPALASGIPVKVNAATGGHKFTVTKW